MANTFYLKTHLLMQVVMYSTDLTGTLRIFHASDTL